MEPEAEFILKFFETVPIVRGRNKFRMLILIGQKELGLPCTIDVWRSDGTEWLDRLVGSYIRERVDWIDDECQYTYVLTREGIATARSIKEFRMRSSDLFVLRCLSDLPDGVLLNYIMNRGY